MAYLTKRQQDWRNTQTGHTTATTRERDYGPKLPRAANLANYCATYNLRDDFKRYGAEHGFPDSLARWTDAQALEASVAIVGPLCHRQSRSGLDADGI